MKTAILSLAVLSILGLTSCEKKDWSKKHCESSLDKEGSYKEYIYEPLVTSDDCDCIVAGKVKYVGECGTLALLDYGDGTCDDIATKTICIDGDCDHCGAYTVEVVLECTGTDPDTELSAGPE